MSIHIPGNGPRPLFQGASPRNAELDEPDRALLAIELAHKADKAMRDRLDQASTPGGLKKRNIEPGADVFRSVLAEAPDDATKAAAGGHLAASITSFALERAATQAEERAALREDTLRRRKGDIAGHMTRLTEIIAADPKPKIREAAAQAVAAQIQSLDEARRTLGRGDTSFSSGTQKELI